MDNDEIPMTDAVRQAHWDTVYTERGAQDVSWYQADPRLSLDLVKELAAQNAEGKDSAVIDVGGGASLLASRLVTDGFTDVTVLDISSTALGLARTNPGADKVTWVWGDLLTWRPERRYQIWHDRAVFHFLTAPADRAVYLNTLYDALAPGGAIVLGTFAAHGPTRCSGLPVVRYSSEELAEELVAAYGDKVAIVERRGEQHRTPTGTVQPFTWIAARLG